MINNALGMELGIYTCNGPTTCGGCVASQGYEDKDMQTFADWGASYVKVDSCVTNCTGLMPPPPAPANYSICKEKLWKRFTSAIQKTQRPMVYSLVCNCAPDRGLQPWKWAAPFVNSWRTSLASFRSSQRWGPSHSLSEFSGVK
jgi:alpha-galactosidase